MNISYICKDNVYNNDNKLNLTYTRCTRQSPLSRTNFSGPISQTSGFGPLQAYTRMKICNKGVNILFNCSKILVAKERYPSFLS